MRLKGRSVLVTGGTGMIGQAVCRHLHDAGCRVTALSRHGLPVHGAASHKADVLDPELDLSGFDCVVHGAAMVAFGQAKHQEAVMHRVNVEGTRNVLEAAARGGVKKVVHVSSVAAIGRTGGTPRDEAWAMQRPAEYHSAYERSKHEAHKLAMTFDGLPVTAVLPSIVVGLGDTSSGQLLDRFLRRKIPAVPQHPGRLAFVHLEDVAAGTVAALQRGTGAYVLNECSLNLPDLFARFEGATGVPAPRRKLPFWMLQAGAAAEPLLRPLGLAGAVNRDFVRSLALDTVFVADRARRELDWHPDMDRHLGDDGRRFGAGPVA